jgi:peptidoglycan/LPS O-acetylase OafA/YrhL
MDPKTDRIYEIDILRGFAIMAIIGVHTIFFFSFFSAGFVGLIISTFLGSLVTLGVPIFFIVSGLVLSLRYKPRVNFHSFVKKRAISIFPPYLTISLVFILFYAIFGLETIDLIKIPLWLLTGTVSSTFWFLVVLMQLYLLFPLISSGISKLGSKKLEWSILFVLFIISVFYSFGWSYLSGVFLANPSLASLYHRILLAGIFYFVIGVYLGMNYHAFVEKMHRIPSFWIWTMFTASLLFSVVWSLLGIGNGLSGFPYILVGLFGNAIGTIVCVLGFFFLFDVSGKALLKNGLFGATIKKLGDFSFGMYLVFMLFVNLLSIEVLKIGTNKADWTLFPLFYLLVLVSSYLASRTLSYLPHSRLIIGDNPTSRRKITTGLITHPLVK